MAKKFGDSPLAKRFDEVAGDTMADTSVTSVKLIKNSAIIDYPNNGEDISYTADIENSIKELGFTDPIEITDYGMPKGRYVIVSGHRRRAAGVKCGMVLFPCIIKSFDNENDVKNYVLLANSHRDTAKDPLLYCNRYKMHEQHLKAIGFKGSVREEIAKRLGMSVQQADRYNQMNKIISPVWDLVRQNIVGMSNVLPMAVLNRQEQQDILDIFMAYIERGEELTRETISQIIAKYKSKDNLKSPHREEIPESKKSTESKVSAAEAVRRLSGHLKKANFTSKDEAGAFLSETDKMISLLLDKFYLIGKIHNLEPEVNQSLENFADKIKKSSP